MVRHFKQVKDDSHGFKMFKGRLWVPKFKKAQKLLLSDVHCTCYSMHPNNTTMCRMLKSLQWWLIMKIKVVRYLERCKTFLHVKSNHQKPCRNVQLTEKIGTIYPYLHKLFERKISIYIHQKVVKVMDISTNSHNKQVILL